MSSNAAPPTTPEGFRFAVYSQSVAELFWLRSSGDPLVIGYELTRNGEVLGLFDVLSYTDRTLDAGIPYEYTITAIDTQGTRSETVPTTVLIPASSEGQIAALRQEIASLQAQLSQRIPSPVASTGQTASVQFGDDASVGTGVTVTGERFIDNNNGTFTDRLTAITWLGVRDCIVKRDWIQAIDYANAMADDGMICPALTDGSVAGNWRLPTIKELQSLIDVSNDNPAFADGIPYQGSWSANPWDSYWSSSSFGPAPELNGWQVTADYGYTGFSQKNLSMYSWPIKVSD